MKRFFHIAAICVAALACNSALAQTLVIENVRIVDVTAENEKNAVAGERSIHVENGVIVGITRRSPVLADAQVIDGAGLYAIPGLWDMHAHLAVDLETARRHLALQLAHGVTSMRDMGTDLSPQTLKELREDMNAVGALGPRILQSAISSIDGEEGQGEFGIEPPFEKWREGETIAAIAQKRIRAGADMIKTYDNLTREQYAQAAAAAKKYDMTLVGHVPQTVSLLDAVAAGHKSIEHATTLTRECSRAWPHWRDVWEDRLRRGEMEPSLTKILIEEAQLSKIAEEYDPVWCERLMQILAEENVAYVPTLGTRRMEAYASLQGFGDDERLKFITDDMKKRWERDRNRYRGLSRDAQAGYFAFYLRSLDVTELAWRQGVTILAGTDAPDSYIFPGSGLHDEIGFLVDAGLPPLAALKTATINAATFLGVQETQGSLKTGARADIVLLRDNPLEDISNTRNIEYVVHAGVVTDRKKLDGVISGAIVN